MKESFNIIDKFSSLRKLQRLIAYCLRFEQNTTYSNKSFKLIGPLSVDELNNSLMCLIKLSQAESFSNDIKHIENDHFNKLSS